MIKSKLETEEASYTYPFLGIFENNGKVVLFISRGRGVVVRPGSCSKEPVGHYSDGWRMEAWKPLPRGSVLTLTVED